jgi:hypothetical protein
MNKQRGPTLRARFALEQIEIVAKIPAGLIHGDLRFNPCWEALRGHPRFEKIVAVAKAASRCSIPHWTLSVRRSSFLI